MTDADVVLGRIDPHTFAGGQIRLAPGKAVTAVDRSVGARLGFEHRMAAFGICEFVDESMATAARVHAVELGKNVGSRTLIAFGGAGPLHATRLAEKLSVDRVLVPTSAGVGSALGFLRAPIAFEAVRSRYMLLRELSVDLVNELFRVISEEAISVVRSGAPTAPLEENRSAFMRYAGQGHEISVPLPNRDLTPADIGLLQQGYEDAYRQLYGRIIPELAVEVLSWGLAVRAPRPISSAPPPIHRRYTPEPIEMRKIQDGTIPGTKEVPVYWRPSLQPGARIAGPALIAEDETTIVVGNRFDAEVDGSGYVVMQNRRGSNARDSS